MRLLVPPKPRRRCGCLCLGRFPFSCLHRESTLSHGTCSLLDTGPASHLHEDLLLGASDASPDSKRLQASRSSPRPPWDGYCSSLNQGLTCWCWGSTTSDERSRRRPGAVQQTSSELHRRRLLGAGAADTGALPGCNSTIGLLPAPAGGITYRVMIGIASCCYYCTRKTWEI